MDLHLAQGEVSASKQKASRILAASSAAISISECHAGAHCSRLLHLDSGNPVERNGKDDNRAHDQHLRVSADFRQIHSV